MKIDTSDFELEMHPHNIPSKDNMVFSNKDPIFYDHLFLNPPPIIVPY